MAKAGASALGKSSLVAAVLLAGVVALMFRGQGVHETLQRWGLPGTWALDCGKPGNGDAPRVRYVRRKDGSAAVEHHFDGPKYSDVGTVTMAVIGADGTITLTFESAASKQVRIISLLKSGDRMRALSERVAGTDIYSVREGRFTSNDSETPWQQRCDG